LGNLVYTSGMMRKWEIVTSGPEVAHAVMERDAQLLASLEACPRPILHLYEWAGPSATYGHFIRLEEHVDLEAAGVEGVTFAKRPTGGGIVFHITDLAFSLLLPANDPECSSIPIENYQFVNRIVAQAVEKLVGERLTLLPTEEEPAGPAGFCMARPTR
jgi:lipoate---protein ligase